jgi:hypothetical protein
VPIISKAGALATQDSEHDTAVALAAGTGLRPAGQQQQAADDSTSKQMLTSTVSTVLSRLMAVMRLVCLKHGHIDWAK